MNMPLKAYTADGPPRAQMSYANRDNATGVLGTLTMMPPSIAEANDMLSMEEKVWAYLGREPDSLVYIADEDGRVLRMMLSNKHHEAVKKAARTTAVGWALLVLCVTTFVGSTLAGLGGLGIAILAAIICLYLLVVRLGIQNEVEGAVVCEIILILVLVLVPTLQKARNAARSPAPAVSLRLLSEARIPRV